MLEVALLRTGRGTLRNQKFFNDRIVFRGERGCTTDEFCMLGITNDIGGSRDHTNMVSISEAT